MQISLIAAMANHRVIGRENHMPWHLPADFAWFRQQTLHKPVIMGRHTYHSIGRPLVDRINIVLSHQQGDDDRVYWANSIDQALQLAGEAAEVMIIGGAQIYQTYLPMAHKLYLTHIDAEIAGDTYFPDYHAFFWQQSYHHIYQSDAKNAYTLRFEILTRQMPHP